MSKDLSMFTLKTHQMSKKRILSNPQFAHPKVPQLQKFGRICATPTRQKLLQALPQDQRCTSWNHLLPIFQTSIQWVHMGSMFVFGCVHAAMLTSVGSFPNSLTNTHHAAFAATGGPI